jgi:probable F420-dependent oxidoreductase
MTDPAFYVPLALAAEELGFDSFMVPDSICYPAEADTRYPYNADGTREFLDDKPFIDPMALIGHLSAVTTSLRFVTSVIKLPLRHPVLMAKQATSVAVLSNNRLVLGVGTSPWHEDYEICDVPWEHRGKRLDESIDIIRALTAGGYAEYHGDIYEVPRIKMSPAPSQPIPIVIGGHSDAALRRAARIGDGWSAAGGDDAFLTTALARLDEMRKEYGREHLPFDVYAGSVDAFSADGVRRLEERGVAEVFIGFRDPYVAGPDTQSLEEKLGMLNWFAGEVIAKVR